MDIGFYLPIISNNSTHHEKILDTINNLCELRPYDNIVIFNNYFHCVHDNKKYYVISSNHAKYFKGVLFIFSTQDALLTQTFPCPTQQILYLTQPEWAADHRLPYTLWHNIYMNEKFQLIANDDTYELVDICWKKPLKKITNFNYKDIDDVIRSIQ